MKKKRDHGDGLQIKLIVVFIASIENNNFTVFQISRIREKSKLLVFKFHFLLFQKVRERHRTTIVCKF